jgi:hypothetical protein
MLQERLGEKAESVARENVGVLAGHFSPETEKLWKDVLGLTNPMLDNSPFDEDSFTRGKIAGKIEKIRKNHTQDSGEDE